MTASLLLFYPFYLQHRAPLDNLNMMDKRREPLNQRLSSAAYFYPIGLFNLTIEGDAAVDSASAVTEDDGLTLTFAGEAVFSYAILVDKHFLDILGTFLGKFLVEFVGTSSVAETNNLQLEILIGLKNLSDGLNLDLFASGNLRLVGSIVDGERESVELELVVLHLVDAFLEFAVGCVVVVLLAHSEFVLEVVHTVLKTALVLFAGSELGSEVVDLVVESVAVVGFLFLSEEFLVSLGETEVVHVAQTYIGVEGASAGVTLEPTFGVDNVIYSNETVDEDGGVFADIPVKLHTTTGVEAPFSVSSVGIAKQEADAVTGHDEEVNFAIRVVTESVHDGPHHVCTCSSITVSWTIVVLSDSGNTKIKSNIPQRVELFLEETVGTKSK